jgi:hypothetical protein
MSSRDVCTLVCVTKELRPLFTHIPAHLGIFRFSEVYSWLNLTQMAKRTRQLVACVRIPPEAVVQTQTHVPTSQPRQA